MTRLTKPPAPRDPVPISNESPGASRAEWQPQLPPPPKDETGMAKHIPLPSPATVRSDAATASPGPYKPMLQPPP